MNQHICPCIWIANTMNESIDFYSSLFNQTNIISQSPLVSYIELMGTKFMLLNGGNKYKPNSSISYYIYCENVVEIERLYNRLIEHGRILMPLGKYDWSEQYAWVEDEYGVNWQLDIDKINSTQKIVPSLLFANDKMKHVKKAIDFYTNTFSNSEILLEAPYPMPSIETADSLLFAQVKLNGFILNTMSSIYPHDFNFTPGNSFVVECDSQKEIDHYWEILGKDGRYDMCGWLSDQFGVSWQIIPSILKSLMSDQEKAPRVINAFLKMQKFDIDTLLNA